jgi:hypothetical protein
VQEGRYVETEEGWARADLSSEEVRAANEIGSFVRYFEDQQEIIPREQYANAVELANLFSANPTYPDTEVVEDTEFRPAPGSNPFRSWDTGDPHWREDARAEETRELMLSKVERSPEEEGSEGAGQVIDIEADESGDEEAQKVKRGRRKAEDEERAWEAEWADTQLERAREWDAEGEARRKRTEFGTPYDNVRTVLYA